MLKKLTKEEEIEIWNKFRLIVENENLDNLENLENAINNNLEKINKDKCNESYYSYFTNYIQNIYKYIINKIWYK